MRYLKLVAEFEPTAPILFPQNPVNTFRGALGYHLKRTLCIQRARDSNSCRGCLAGRQCFYALCFETVHLPETTNEFLGKGDDVPHPMVTGSGFFGPKEFHAGECFRFSVTLFGPSVQVVPYMVHAFREIAASGLGSKKVPCVLREVSDGTKVLYRSETERLDPVEPRKLALIEPHDFGGRHGRKTIRFLTPTSFKDKSSGGVSNRAEFSKLIGSVLRRHSTFLALDGQSIPEWNYRLINEKAREVQMISKDLCIEFWERYSTRQHQRAFWGGVVGPAEYEGDLEPFIPLLRAGEILHVGRGTTFGQGKYELRADNPAIEPDKV